MVHTGTAEILYDDRTAFVRNMKRIQGNNIKLLETLNAPHDIFASGIRFRGEGRGCGASESRIICSSFCTRVMSDGSQIQECKEHVLIVCQISKETRESRRKRAPFIAYSL